MENASRELAYRTAVAAAPFVGTLATDLSQAAHFLRVGDVSVGLESLENQTARLQRFLTFLVVASEALVEAHSPVGAQVGEYAQRLMAIITRIETALDDRDMMGLSITLEHGLSHALAEYDGYAHDVKTALAICLAA